MDVTREMRALDLVTSCPICHDTFQSPVILTTCGHSFCSACIRRYFTFTAECPQCRVTCSAVEILPNRVLEDVLGAYCKLRDGYERARTENAGPPATTLVVAGDYPIIIDGPAPTPKLKSLTPALGATKTIMKPLAKPVYHMLKDVQIRAKLQELGLKTTGDRNTIIRRHSEYVVLHNAECDSSSPKPPAQLRRMLEKTERTWTVKRI